MQIKHETPTVKTTTIQPREMAVDNINAMNQAVCVLKALAKMCAEGKSITIDTDWDYGTGTIINPEDGSHTHFGLDVGDNEEEQLIWFINGLYNELVLNNGLTWVKPEKN